MSRHGRIALAVGGVLLVAALGAWWFFSTHRRVDEVKTLPPRGEAAYNPLYALKLALRAAGVPAQSRQRLELAKMALRPGDSVVLMGDLSMLPPADVEALLRWVRAGGQLVVPMPRPLWLDGPEVDEEGKPIIERAPIEADTRDTRRAEALFARFGVGRLPGGKCLRVRDGKTDYIYFCGSPRLSLHAGHRATLRVKDADGTTVVLRVPHGTGFVTVASDLSLIQSDELDEPPATTLAWRMLQPGSGTVHLIYSAEMTPLWRVVLVHGWNIWLPLLLAVLAGLWAARQRWGTLLPSPADGRRSLLEHLQAAGELQHRYGRGHVLYQQARAAFDARLRRRDPYAAALDGEARIEAIAARTGWSPQDVRRALQAPRPFDPQDLQLRITRLVQLRTRL